MCEVCLCLGGGVLGGVGVSGGWWVVCTGWGGVMYVCVVSLDYL